MSCKKTVSVSYTIANQTVVVDNVQLDHLLDVFVPLKISSITSLQFSNNSLTAPELEMICPLIPQKLQNLNLSNLALNGRAITVLAKRITYSQIRSVDLSNNPIGDESIWVLLDAIGKNEYLTSLSLVNCNLTGNGVWTLLNVIAQKKFDFLDISENLISSIGADYVLQFLKRDPIIREFHIDRASISVGDIEALINAGEKCTKMEIFSIKNNGLISFRTVSPKILVDTLPIMK